MLGSIYFLVKCSILKVPTVHNAGSKLSYSLHKKEMQQFQNALISCNLLKTFRLI